MKLAFRCTNRSIGRDQPSTVLSNCRFDRDALVKHRIELSIIKNDEVEELIDGRVSALCSLIAAETAISKIDRSQQASIGVRATTSPVARLTSQLPSAVGVLPLRAKWSPLQCDSLLLSSMLLGTPAWTSCTDRATPFALGVSRHCRDPQSIELQTMKRRPEGAA
jgi:hypothetical protein